MKCRICGSCIVERAHLITKRNLPKKDRWNERFWIYLCRKHHMEQHTIGIVSFCKKYKLIEALRNAGFAEWKIKNYG